ncbi:MAG: hypothetical protein DI533_20965 [Cereibacter sphaeroides]|uniref:Glycosyltransferase 2-like domain-containing protein n=1 Tax=Cereibacter sphaeroides TaxID=1063 RepID=A0A2W5S752_CERSP|nr:MAG: hypothetical protein DI533_20965 [Cereibacter sphaeroides]
MTDTPLPRIAVVIPCYNSEAWIARTINSVLDQSYADRLVIVVDDGSRDASADRVRAFLLVGAAKVAAETGADIVLSDMHIVDAEGRRQARSVYSGSITPETFFEGWLNGLYFNPSSILWRIDFVQRIGGWDESLARAQDLDITLRAMFERPRVMKNDQGVAVYARINPASVSRSDSPRATESRMKVTLGLLAQAKGTAFEQYSPLLLAKLYTITRTAFQTGQTALGRRGVSELKNYGFQGNPGSRFHRLLSRLIGLEAKVKLWGN